MRATHGRNLIKMLGKVPMITHGSVCCEGGFVTLSGSCTDSSCIKVNIHRRSAIVIVTEGELELAMYPDEDSCAFQENPSTCFLHAYFALIKTVIMHCVSFWDSPIIAKGVLLNASLENSKL